MTVATTLGRASMAMALTCISSTAAAATPVTFAQVANIQYDWARLDSDAGRGDEHGFRRARVGFKLKDHAGRWQFVAEHDVADKTAADAYLELTPAKGHAIRVGQFKQPFLLEDAVSDKQTPLLEQSLVGVFAISRRIGIEYARAPDWGTINAAVFDQRLDGTSQSRGASPRGTWLLRSGDTETAHIGASVATESPDNERASFRVTPGTTLTDLRLGSTGSLNDVDRLDRTGLEGLWIRAAWSLQAELAQVTARRPGADFDGHASSVLTDGGMAWELALRWSAIDLDDGVVAGGRVDSVGLGATCYINKRARISGNLLRFDRRGIDDHPTDAGLRLQLT